MSSCHWLRERAGRDCVEGRPRLLHVADALEHVAGEAKPLDIALRILASFAAWNKCVHCQRVESRFSWLHGANIGLA